MQEPWFEDVTGSEAGEAPFGVVVSALEDRGFRVLGRIAQRRVPGGRLAHDREARGH
ncbi:hypothetical protein [Nocardioides taihuensis]|uniref:Uncharacterized protein n=1 Tax=Nocardioides taihuensis TaxID=1835606 RepID=A0ABW0BP27_9ACTN